jgi:hypothetical protein
MRKFTPVLLLISLLTAILVFVNLGPSERTLGVNVRLVYLHGAWVWTALIGFILAGVLGVAGLILRRDPLQRTSVALGQTGTIFWITYLPISLWTMQANWGGLYLLEPRWRLAVNFAIVAVMIQAAIWIMQNWAAASALNAIFILALAWGLSGSEQVMHPPSPILDSDSLMIRIFFFLLLMLCLLAAGQLSRLLLRYSPAAE